MGGPKSKRMRENGRRVAIASKYYARKKDRAGQTRIRCVKKRLMEGRK